MSDLVTGRTGDWEVVIGLEVHAQVSSKAKLFSGASASFGAAPNENVSLVDAAMPGMLPVINRECVYQAIRTGLGLKAQINLTSVFDRKKLFLCRSAARLSDQPVQGSDCRRGLAAHCHG
jgi:aspartyl-tRNA(Asn)/glutamyl-tRNA(Gln) amidotransferase subunit B